jgi:phage terminase large subunit-like protein
MAGRGFGKTRLAAEDIADYGLWNPGHRQIVVAATSDDLRRVCFEGDSGLLSVIPDACISDYNKTLHEITLFNGGLIQGFSSEKPDRLRGPQGHRAWCDELAAWRYPEAWDMLMFGLRLGEKPQCVVSTTPRPTKIIKELVSRKDVYVTRGSTYDNAANLAPTFISQLVTKYEGTRLGRQELNAELLLDNPGALWKRDNIEEARLRVYPELIRIVVAIDPAVTSKADSDETGIIVAGIATIKDTVHGFILDDKSMRGTPDEWAKEAVRLYHHWKADRIIGETNNGGDMIEAIIRTIDRNVSYKGVHASRGKQIRAEPISALYEQRRVHHVGMFAELEDQLCEWDPATADASPDRLDALVWALTELMTENQHTGFLDYYKNLTTKN